jgi:hypothetical protein
MLNNRSSKNKQKIGSVYHGDEYLVRIVNFAGGLWCLTENRVGCYGDIHGTGAKHPQENGRAFSENDNGTIRSLTFSKSLTSFGLTFLPPPLRPLLEEAGIFVDCFGLLLRYG